MPILTILIAWPAVTGLLLLTVPQLRAWAREFAIGASVVELALVVGLVASFDRSQAGTVQFYGVHSWIPQIGTSWALGVNGIGLSLVALSALLVPIVIAAGWKEDDAAPRRAQYLGLILVSESFMVGIFAARDVFLFYVLFEAMLIP